MKLLLIIDAQQAIINDKNTAIIDSIIEHVKSETYDLVIATRFVNKVGTFHYQNETRKDMTLLSQKSKLVQSISDISDITIMKSTYTALTGDLSKLIEKNKLEEVYISGFNIEDSIMSTAIQLYDNGIKPVILSDLCGTINSDKENLLEILSYSIGKENIL